MINVVKLCEIRASYYHECIIKVETYH